MSEINRREFVAGAAAVATSVCTMSCLSGRAMADDAPAGSTTVDVGPKTDYAKDGMSDKFVMSNHVLIIRENGKIYATTSVCTHRGADVAVQGDILHCPKHGSEFSNAGLVTKGPAKDPLIRHAISVNADGHLIVDTSKKFSQDQWTDAASFIAA